MIHKDLTVLVERSSIDNETVTEHHHSCKYLFSPHPMFIFLVTLCPLHSEPWMSNLVIATEIDTYQIMWPLNPLVMNRHCQCNHGCRPFCLDLWLVFSHVTAIKISSCQFYWLVITLVFSLSPVISILSLLSPLSSVADTHPSYLCQYCVYYYSQRITRFSCAQVHLNMRTIQAWSRMLPAATPPTQVPPVVHQSIFKENFLES